MLSAGETGRIVQGQDGFTLVEMLVGMATGLIVMVVLLTILKVSADQTRLVTAKVETDRLGRQAMTHMVDNLQSACISREAVPIYSESTPRKLIFFDAFTNQAEMKTPAEETKEKKPASEGVYVRELVFEPGVGATGKLKEKIYPSTEVVVPDTVKYEKGKPEETVQLATNLEQMTITEENGKKLAKAKTLPMFEYLKYGKEAKEEVNAPVTPLEPISVSGETSELGSSASEAAAVKISFEQTPTRKKEITSETSEHQGVAVQSQVTLALGSPSLETPIVDQPCD